MTYPYSTKCSEQRVVPFHKRKLLNFCSHSNYKSNEFISLSKSIKSLSLCKVQPMLGTFYYVPYMMCVYSENSKHFQIMTK